MSQTKVIVKVGNKSDIRFRDVNAYRAITLTELENLVLLNPDTDIVILEDIKKDEYLKAKEFISSHILTKADKSLLVYSKVADSIVIQLATELELPTFNSITGLHDYIENKHNIKVSTQFKMLNESTKTKQDSSNDNTESINKLLALLHKTEKEKNEAYEKLLGANEQLKLITDIKDAIEDERNVYKRMLDDIQDNSEIIEDPISLTEYQGIQEQLKNLEVENETLRNNIDSGLINKDKIDYYESELNTFKDISAQQAVEIKSLREELTIEKTGRRKLMGLLANGVTEIDNINSALNIKSQEILKLAALVEKLKSSNDSMAENLHQLETKNIELMKCSENVDFMISTATQTIQLELDSVKINNIELGSNIDILKANLLAKELQYNELVKACGMDETGASSLLETNRGLELLVNQLGKQVINLEEELGKSKQTEHQTNQSCIKLTEENEKYKLALHNATSNLALGNTGKSLIRSFKYTGRAILFPVFGSGSFGVTTTAMSIASKLSITNKVLYIDFDIAGPKADSWFGVIPIENNDTKQSGLGTLIEKGAIYFANNADTFIKKVKKTKGGSIDYISGLYAKHDSVKFMAADFQTFFNFCGSNYDYIIMDMGRLGTNDLNNAITKTVCDMADRIIAVSQNDLVDARSLRINIQTARLDLSKLVWLFNMCKSTSVTKGMDNIIPTSDRIMMPFEDDIFGEKRDFLYKRITKDRLEGLVSTIIKPK